VPPSPLTGSVSDRRRRRGTARGYATLRSDRTDDRDRSPFGRGGGIVGRPVVSHTCSGHFRSSPSYRPSLRLPRDSPSGL